MRKVQKHREAASAYGMCGEWHKKDHHDKRADELECRFKKKLSQQEQRMTQIHEKLQSNKVESDVSFGVPEEDPALVKASELRKERRRTFRPKASTHSACTSTFYARQHQDERTCFLFAAIGFIVKVLHHDTILMNAHKILRPMKEKMSRSSPFLAADLITEENGTNKREIRDDVMDLYMQCCTFTTEAKLLDPRGGDFYCLFIAFLLSAGWSVAFIYMNLPVEEVEGQREPKVPDIHKSKQTQYRPYLGVTDTIMTEPSQRSGKKRRASDVLAETPTEKQRHRSSDSITYKLAELTMKEPQGPGVVTQRHSIHDIRINEYTIIRNNVTGANSYFESLQLLQEIQAVHHVYTRFAGCFISMHLPREDHVVFLVRCGTILQICDSNNGTCIDIKSALLPPNAQVFRVDYIIVPQDVALDTDLSMSDV